jgi:hypothetical protein
MDNSAGDYLHHFTGKGVAFDLVCTACGRAPAAIPDSLVLVCPACISRIEQEGPAAGFLGEPEVQERATRLHFSHETFTLPTPLRGNILDLQPVQRVDQDLWIAITRNGEIVRLDLDHGPEAVTLCRLSLPVPDLSVEVSLHLSGCAQMAAIVNTRGQQGVVVNLQDGRTTMTLDRGTYHNEHCKFPVAFCETEDRLLLIHGTDWNRLDISDPRTGRLLTERSPTPYQQGQPRPEHDLDYFHCGLTVSPGGDFIVDNGWVWHPDGVVVVWALRPWLRENVWESEDGPSRKALCHRAYFWDGPLCWIDNERLAVWGYGDDEDNLLPAVRIFNAVSGEEERWFPGPREDLVCDGPLFSFDAAEGMSVWDVAGGERLLQEAGFCPNRYHPGAKVFLSLRPDGLVQVSRLRGRPINPGWLSTDGGRVGQVARSIQADQDFEALPVLADALEEAGCQDQHLLDHCRRPGPHGRDCWVIDWLLHGEGE